MIYLKHRSASGTLSQCWEFCPQRRCAILVIDGKGFDVHVCSERAPRVGAYAIRRLTETTFRLAPSKFEKRREHWASYVAPYEDGLPAEFIELTHAPADVAQEMGELF